MDDRSRTAVPAIANEGIPSHAIASTVEVIANEGIPSHATASTVEGKLSIVKSGGPIFMRMPYIYCCSCR